MSSPERPTAATDRRRRAARGYAVAASVALVAAAALRFDGLGESSLGMDEARVAVWMQGSLAEVFENTATYHSSPILHPLALWLVQKIEISAFSVRLLPALGSTLTVAALLFLLPSAGVSRRAAFLSGTLAAISAAAVIEAHGVVVYSLDALVAALLIVGLFRYVRDGGGRVLLGICLFLGPLVQYGLVLFGAAILVTAVLLPAPAAASPPPKTGARSVRLRARAPLLQPAALFAVGVATSYGTTLQRQLLAQAPKFEGGRALVLNYLSEMYYGGHPADLPALFRFLSSAIGDLLRDHLAAPLVVASLGAGVWTLGLRRFRRSGAARSRKDDPNGVSPNSVSLPRVSPPPASPLRVVLLLFTVSLAFAAFAAVAGIYPLGDSRHGTYLGPVIVTVAGSLLAAATTLPTPRFGRLGEKRGGGGAALRRGSSSSSSAGSSLSAAPSTRPGPSSGVSAPGNGSPASSPPRRGPTIRSMCSATRCRSWTSTCRRESGGRR